MVIDFNKGNGGGGSGSSYVLSAATADRLGGIMVGSGLSITSAGTLSADAQQVGIATTAQTGVVKIGSGITVDSAGTISVSGGSGVEVVTSLPASGTDGQIVNLVTHNTDYIINITGKGHSDRTTSITAVGITQRTKLFDFNTWTVLNPFYVNSDGSYTLYETNSSQEIQFPKNTTTVHTIDVGNGNIITFTGSVTDNVCVITYNKECWKENIINDITQIGGEKQTLFVYGTEPKPAIEYHLSADKRLFDMNWVDIQNVMADEDVLFNINNFGDIRYSGGTLYSQNQSGFGVKTPSSTVQNYSYIYFVLDGDILSFWLKYNRTVSGGTLFSGKARMSGWTRVGVVQENIGEGYATNERAGMVMVNNRSDGLYMEDGFIKCSVSAQTAIATTAQTGVVKIGQGINVDSAGTISVSGSGEAEMALALKSIKEDDDDNYKVVNEGGWLYYVEENGNEGIPVKIKTNAENITIEIGLDGQTAEEGETEEIVYIGDDNGDIDFNILLDDQGQLFYVDDNDTEVYYSPNVNEYIYGDFTFYWSDDGKRIEFSQNATNPMLAYCTAQKEEKLYCVGQDMRMANVETLGLVKIGNGLIVSEDGTISIDDDYILNLVNGGGGL